MAPKDEATQTQHDRETGAASVGSAAAAAAAEATTTGNATTPTQAATSTAPEPDRRQAARQKYQVVATLEPVSTAAAGREDVRVVTRDADARGTGFVSDGELPEGARAVLHLPAPDGGTQRIECRVRRSREIANGLFEGSVEFLGHQPQFSETRITFAQRRR